MGGDAATVLGTPARADDDVTKLGFDPDATQLSPPPIEPDATRVTPGRMGLDTDVTRLTPPIATDPEATRINSALTDVTQLGQGPTGPVTPRPSHTYAENGPLHIGE